ncbi:unnamed protein product [Cyprideis torosa]|uniref:Histone acetyltransferase n=1 Tax=Cyprideis torosa TaxID=163714 RepID=A0A7R8W723_9CRUS|nr:unnamed protein product [Cyprideis torosa]CAG0881957.1 unnamed protein product [Cyprideis torosa]
MGRYRSGYQGGSSSVVPKAAQSVKKPVAPTRPSASLTFEVEDLVRAKRRNGEWRKGIVLHARGRSDHRGVWGHEYLIHFENLNKRLDEWLGQERLEKIGAKDSIPAIPSKPAFRSEEAPKMRTLTRNQKRQIHTENPAEVLEELDPAMAALEREHESLTRIKYIELVQFGWWEMHTWYFSPYPKGYGKVPHLYVCEYCLKYMKSEKTFRYHLTQCTQRQPPGKAIYCDETLNLRLYEVEGKKEKNYCQCLCLFAKLFLDHKTLYYDVEPFLFYILTTVDRTGSHIVGYFSKERESTEGYNLACILILPPFQRQGYGKFMIQFSYELTKLEGVVGSPEKPLSDLGSVSYRSYWTYSILNILKNFRGTMSIKDLSKLTGIAQSDIICTLQSMNMVKYYKGEHTVCVTVKAVEDHLKTVPAPKIKLQPQM